MDDLGSCSEGLSGTTKLQLENRCSCVKADRVCIGACACFGGGCIHPLNYAPEQSDDVSDSDS